MASEKFGYRTFKKVWVLKAHEEDAKDMSNLYRNIKVEEVRTLRSLLMRGQSFISVLGKDGRPKYKTQQLTDKEIENCQKRWLDRIRGSEEDYYKDVIYVVRDKNKKMVGVLETLSEDGREVEVQIWIPQEFKRKEFLEEVVESVKEWLILEEKYEEITKIMLGDAIGREVECLVTNCKKVS